MSSEDIEFFFTTPEVLPESEQARRGNSFSVLYLLRREIQDSLVDLRCIYPGGLVQPEDRFAAALLDPGRGDGMHRLFASTMLIFGGIDLLGKFFAGNDQRGKVGKRFTGFVKAYMKSVNPDVAWAARNALMHSFGLYDKDVDTTTGQDRSKKIALLQLPRRPIADTAVTQVSGVWMVCIPLLYRDFTDAIHSYKKALSTDADLQKNFNRMFGEYGTLAMYKITA